MNRAKALALATLITGILGLAAVPDRAEAKDPTKSRWYRATNWVDMPPVQRYIAGSQQFYQENKQVIWGTVKDAAKGRNAGYLILKGVFGYPKDAISR